MYFLRITKISSLLVIFVVITVRADNCSPGWQYHNYFCYKKLPSTADWYNANTQCRNEKAELVSIHTAEEQQFVLQVAASEIVWIGLNDEATEGTFVWSDGTNLVYNSWGSNQPDDVGLEQRWPADCALIDSTKTNMWYDRLCSTQNAAICKRPECPSGWTRHSNSNCYKMFQSEKSWFSAQNSCRSLDGGADLAAINDQSLQDFINNEFINTGGGNDVWIGVHDQNVENVFQYTTGEIVTFFAWHTSQPNDNIMGDDQDCVAALRQNGGRWEDKNCDDKYYYICERSSKFTAVIDSQPPSIYGCPTDITVTAVDQDGGTAFWTAPTATDSSGGSVTMVVSHQPGDVFPMGATTVTYQFSDPASNVATCSFTVNVVLPSTDTTATVGTATVDMGLCQDGNLCNISSLTIEEVESLSGDPNMASILLLSISRWMKRHDEFPTDVTDITSFTWYYLKICSNLFHPSLKENWELLSQISDGPTQMAINCEKLANSFANLTQMYPVNMDFPNVVSRFEKVPLSRLPGYSITFPSSHDEDAPDDFISIHNGTDFESLYGTGGTSVIVALRFQHGPIFHKRNFWDISESSPLLSLSVLIEGRKVSVPVEYGLQTTRDAESDFDVGYSDESSSVDNRSEHPPQTKCVFWKKPKPGSREPGSWSDYGCDVTMATKGYTLCQCNHTTSFSVLIQVTEVEIGDDHQQALEIITYIGCAISLASLAITLSVLFCLTSLRSERTAIHKNLVVALLSAQILFLSGIGATTNKVACKAIALLLHYFFMAVFCWMLVEGIHLYGKVVQVFNSGEDKIKHYLSIGWGIPVVIVAVAAAINWEGYGSERSCWLTIEGQMIWAFAGPAALIILVNLVILAMVLRIVVTSAAANREKEFDHIKAGVKGALVLLPILGLSWIFGLLAVNEDLIAFQYLFSIFNSLQGFFIFLFQCILNGEVRAALRRAREKRALERGDYQTSTTGGAVFYNTPVSVVSITNNSHRGVGCGKVGKKNESTETVMTDLDYTSNHNVRDAALRDVVMDGELVDKMSQNSGRTTSSPICVQFAEDQSLLSLNSPNYNHAVVERCEVVSLTETEMKNTANM